ncbi:MAG: hypothetical protein AAFP70_16810, partial [Calditrichota bacterium]
MFLIRPAMLVLLLSIAAAAQPVKQSTIANGDESSPSELIGTNSVSYQRTTIDVNNISMRLRNDGLTGLNGKGYYPSRSNITILFNGGLAISGLVNGDIRTAWNVRWPYLVHELLPGRLGDDPNDPLLRFYHVSATDTFGSENYLKWSNAVELGAAFQDLDNDGNYNPWVDRPDILGDYSVWCVYNDGSSLAQRQWLETLPLGIDIQQTVWAYAGSGDLGDILFLRYKLINRSGEFIDSMMFSAWADPQSGYWEDDRVGSSVDRQTSFVYNSGPDNNYGINPPAFGVRLLQGPIIDAPGEVAYSYRGEY